MSETAVAIATPAPADSSTALSVILRAASDPGMDAEKVRALYQIAREIETDQAKKLFHSGMIAAQNEMRPIVRDRKGERNTYAALETIEKAIRPIYTKHGFVLTFNSRTAEAGAITMCCSCMHSGGFAKDYELTGALDITGPSGNKNKTGIQAAGSTVSYLRRYLLCLIFNIVLVNEDDDGAKSGTINQEQFNKILDLLIVCRMEGSAASPFLKFMNVKSVEDIQQRDYDKAVTQLEAKAKRMKD